MNPDPVTNGRIDIQQGPEWLVHLLFNPPGWLSTLLGAVVLGSLVLAGVGLYRRGWELDDETQETMLANATSAVCIMLATVGVVWYAPPLPYAVDVAAGLLGGLAASHVVSREGRSWLRSRDGSERHKRFVVAWQVIAVSAVLPMLLAGSGAMPFLFRGGVLLALVAVAASLYNAAEVSEAAA